VWEAWRGAARGGRRGGGSSRWEREAARDVAGVGGVASGGVGVGGWGAAGGEGGEWGGEVEGAGRGSRSHYHRGGGGAEVAVRTSSWPGPTRGMPTARPAPPPAAPHTSIGSRRGGREGRGGGGARERF